MGSTGRRRKMPREQSPRDSAAGVVSMVNSAEWLERINQSSDAKARAEEKARLASIIWKAIGVVNVHPYGWLEPFAYTRFLGSSYLSRCSYVLVPTSNIIESIEFYDIADYYGVEYHVFCQIRGMRLDLSRLNRSQDAESMPGWYEVSQALSRLVLSGDDILALEAERAVYQMHELRLNKDSELNSEFVTDPGISLGEIEVHELRQFATQAVRRIVSDDWWEGCGGVTGNPDHARYKAGMARLIWQALGVDGLDEHPWLEGRALSRYLGGSIVDHDVHLVGTSFQHHARFEDIHNFHATRGVILQRFQGSTLDDRRFGPLGWPMIAQALMRVVLAVEDIEALGIEGNLR